MKTGYMDNAKFCYVCGTPTVLSETGYHDTETGKKEYETVCPNRKYVGPRDCRSKPHWSEF